MREMAQPFNPGACLQGYDSSEDSHETQDIGFIRYENPKRVAVHDIQSRMIRMTVRYRAMVLWLEGEYRIISGVAILNKAIKILNFAAGPDPSIAASATEMPARGSNLAISDTVAKKESGLQRVRRQLPIFLNGLRYNAIPDTGSVENAMSVDEASRLGLKITGTRRKFLIGNGRMVKSLGIVHLNCSFALGEPCMTWQPFNVFKNLTAPIIIGKTYLDISKTLTLHQHRLEKVWMSAKKAMRVMHLNRPKQLVRCYVNGGLAHANPDTGSEVDLMSPSYASENMLEVEPLEEDEKRVQLADGSIAKLLGKTNVILDIDNGHHKSSTKNKGQFRTFYLLDGLGTDILLGEEVLYDLDIFSDHQDSFVDIDDNGFYTHMNLIIWVKKRTRQMIDTFAMSSSARSNECKSPVWPRLSALIEITNTLCSCPIYKILLTHSFAVTSPQIQALLNNLDAQELYEREVASQKIAALPAAKRLAQERLEEARQRKYHTKRERLIQKRNAAAARGPPKHSVT